MKLGTFKEIKNTSINSEKDYNYDYYWFGNYIRKLPNCYLPSKAYNGILKY